MLRQTVKALGPISVANQSFTSLPLSRKASTQRRPKDPAKEEEFSQARKWLAELGPDTIPERISNISYSKSSGTGGQHTSKTNSKARLSTPLKSLLPLVPRPLHEKIRTSRYYTKDTDSITITSERTRRAKEKKDDCFRKQLTMLKYIGKEAVPGESKGLDPGTPVSEFGPRTLPRGLLRKMSKHGLIVHNQAARALIKNQT